MKRAIVSLAATAVAAGGLMGSAAAPAQAVPPPCGFYQVGGLFDHKDMYNHCGDGPVLVTIVGYGINNQHTVCLPPGIHDLYDYFNAGVFDAYSEGEPCRIRD